jgi:hypothetical protein
MVSHPNRNWHARWVVDIGRLEAHHGPTGLVVRFQRRGDGWDEMAVNEQEIRRALNALHGDTGARRIARLMREAEEIFRERMAAQADETER